jgi:hypothetical protein
MSRTCFYVFVAIAEAQCRQTTLSRPTTNPDFLHDKRQTRNPYHETTIHFAKTSPD